MGQVAKSQRILIIRPSAIGDIVMASPLIDAFRRADPGATIAWLVEPALAEILIDHSGLDEVLVWPKSVWKELFRTGRWVKLGRDMMSFAKTLRSRRFDLALDVQGLFRSRWLAWLSKAPQRIGFESREPGRFLMTRMVSRGPDSKEMSSEYKYLAGVLGLDSGKFEPGLGLSGAVREQACRLLGDRGATGRYAVVCPFTTRPQKHWLEDRWGLLIRNIRESFDLPVVMLGGPQDGEAAARIRHLSGTAVIDLTGQTSLAQAAAIIEQSALVVGVDTGLTHMGVAFRRPLVVLFGSTCPYLTTPHPNVLALHADLPCSPCKRRPVCDGHFECMAALEVSRVVRAIHRVLAVSGREKNGVPDVTEPGPSGLGQ